MQHREVAQCLPQELKSTFLDLCISRFFLFLAEDEKKKQRIWLTLEAKLEIIKLHEEGNLIAKIAQDKFMAESSIRCILNRKFQIRQQAMNSGNHSTKVMTRLTDYGFSVVTEN